MTTEKVDGMGALALQTAVAMVLALVVYLVVAMLAGSIFFITQSFFTVTRPGIIQFMAVIVGSMIGMLAARKSCDLALRNYSERGVFVMFAILTAGAVAVELFLVPMQWNQVNSAAQLITAIIAAYILFWKGEEI